MERKVVELREICEAGSSNIAQKDIKHLSGQYPIYGASGLIKHMDFYSQDKPYIAIVKDGAGVGRAMLLPAYSSVIGTMQYILPNNNVDINYLYHVIANLNLKKYKTGATIPHIYFKNYKAEKIVLPEMKEQKYVANILDKVNEIINLHKEQLDKLDLIVKSRFVEMFGDPIQNPFGWKLKPFLESGNCKNGMNFSADESGVKLQYLGVGDFKNLTKIEDVKKLGQVSLNKKPGEEYILKDGDIVFVRSNGNKALVGRCLAVYPNDIPTTYSGFCIRYRKTDESIDVQYLLQVLKTDSMRSMMAGRGANIQNLNQQILAQLQIPVPPINYQKEFATFTHQVDKLKLEVKRALQKTDILYKALIQQYFN